MVSWAKGWGPTVEDAMVSDRAIQTIFRTVPFQALTSARAEKPLILTRLFDGARPSHPRSPISPLADEVAVTKRTIAQQDGPVVLVGHSYGVVVISRAGKNEKVKAVVYIAAFAPDKGESV